MTLNFQFAWLFLRRRNFLLITYNGMNNSWNLKKDEVINTSVCFFCMIVTRLLCQLRIDFDYPFCFVGNTSELVPYKLKK